MLEDTGIKIKFGPYESHGIIRHKQQKLLGLVLCLTENHYEVELIPSPHLNRLTLEICGREIFRGDIRELPFNLHNPNHPLHKRILNIVQEHINRMTSLRNRPAFTAEDRSREELFPSRATMYSGEEPCSRYKYLGYDLDSVDLEDAAVSGVAGKDVETRASVSSASFDDVSICDAGSCYPICPPCSFASDYTHSVSTGNQTSADTLKTESSGLSASTDLQDNAEISSKVEVMETYATCQECKKCYCICDKIIHENVLTLDI